MNRVEWDLFAYAPRRSDGDADRAAGRTGSASLALAVIVALLAGIGVGAWLI